MPKQHKTEPLQVPHMCWCPSQMLSPMSAGTKTHKSNMQAETKRYYSQTQTNRKLNGQQQQQQPFNGRLSTTIVTSVLKHLSKDLHITNALNTIKNLPTEALL